MWAFCNNNGIPFHYTCSELLDKVQRELDTVPKFSRNGGSRFLADLFQGQLVSQVRKIKLFFLPQLLLSTDKLCKQFGPRSGPTKCQSLSGSKPFDTLIVFLNFFMKRFFFLKKKSTDDNKSKKKIPSIQRDKISQDGRMRENIIWASS